MPNALVSIMSGCCGGGNNYTVCCYGQKSSCKTPCCSPMQYCCPVRTSYMPIQTCCYTVSNNNNNSSCCGGGGC
uniref:Uncharacterized protein n=1 Tax=Apteryx owenii TaxID=8824 RepID=A0A8B9QMJ0_APTOW